MIYGQEMNLVLDLQKMVETVSNGAVSNVSVACKKESTVSVVICVKE